MALEAINKIKNAETKAEEMILEANKKAREIVQQAGVEAETKYNEIINSAKLKAEKLLSVALEEGNNESKPILEMGERDIEKIRNMSTKIKENAINIVVERIVKIHGNS